MAVVAFVIVGFCTDEVKLLGPVQLYVAPATAAVLKLMVLPVQTGVLLEGLGVAGLELTVTDVVPAALVDPLTVTVTLYVPAMAVVALEIVGFCTDELKLLGPVQLYVAPATAAVLKLMVLPEQTGLLLEGLGVATDATACLNTILS